MGVKVDTQSQNYSLNRGLNLNSDTATGQETSLASTGLGYNTNIVNVSQKNVTSTSYTDDNMQISISSDRAYDTDIYVVDIKVSDVSLLKSAFAQDTYGKNITQATSSMAEGKNAILAINGDYYGFRNAGYVIRNGLIYRDVSNHAEDLVLYADGQMKIINEDEVSASQLLEEGAVQVYSFGPGLVEDGQVTVGTKTEVDQAMASNPRTAIGMIEPGHYIMVVSDGRTSASQGLSLYQLANYMKDKGASLAYNLDGGGSSTLYFNGNIINNPTGGRGSSERKVSDIIYLGYEL